MGPYSLLGPDILRDKLHQCSVIIRPILTTDFRVGRPLPTVQTPPDGHITIFINTLESKLLYNPAHNSVSARSLVEDQLANQKNSVQSYINSTMSTSSNFSYFQLSGDQSQYVHPINFNYFQGYGKQATNLTMF
jgi:hypothetical protein